MDADKQLVERLLNSYQTLDHNAMAACYHEEATFSDIAFRLRGREEIQAMWHMICAKGIDVAVESIAVEGDSVRARIVDTYVFSDTGHTVVNRIDSVFQFRDGLIVAQEDHCNPLDWARQAFGGFKGEIVGRIGLLRRMAARKKLRKFIAANGDGG